MPRMPELSISNQEIQTLARYIYQISGIDLDEQKGYLIQTRLKPLLISLNLQSFQELYSQAKEDRTGELEKKIIDAISTQETLFFRDQAPFDLFKFKILPDLIDSKKSSLGKTRISIWSAACSTGQEVYSLAISLLQVVSDLKDVEFDILGTDISEKALAQASYGKYNTFEIERGLPKPILQKYFHPLPDGWRIKDEVRSMVRFEKQNLMQDFSRLGKFDVVLCRNVAIYFTHQDKLKLFSRLAKALEPHGYLLLGGSESLSRDIAPQFESKRYLRATYYHLRPEQQSKDQTDQPATNRQQPSRPQENQIRTRSGSNQAAVRKKIALVKDDPVKPAKRKARKQAPEPEPAPAPRGRKIPQGSGGQKRLLARFVNKGSSSAPKPEQAKKEQGPSGRTLLQRLAEEKKSKKK
ncbi:MAG: CheR family methyltransferase [Desulfohalobiaceae bacterium]